MCRRERKWADLKVGLYQLPSATSPNYELANYPTTN